jgi:hypothetical protein
MGDNSFLRDFKARMLSSRRAMLRSIILRFSSSESPAETSGEKQLDFRSEILRLNLKKNTSRHVIYNRCGTRRDKCIPQ